MSEFFTTVENRGINRGILKSLKTSVDAAKRKLGLASNLEALEFLDTSQEDRELFYQAYGRDG